MNDNIKDWIERKKMSMPAVNDKIRELIEGQQQEFEMAVFGSGQYDLSENYNHLKKERHEWNAMNKSERELSLQNFWKSTSKTPIAQLLLLFRPSIHQNIILLNVKFAQSNCLA